MRPPLTQHARRASDGFQPVARILRRRGGAHIIRQGLLLLLRAAQQGRFDRRAPGRQELQTPVHQPVSDENVLPKTASPGDHHTETPQPGTTRPPERNVRPKPNRVIRVAGLLLAPLLLAGAMIAQTGAASAAVAGQGGHRGVLYVSRYAKPYHADGSCRSAAFRTIQSAVNAAPAGSTVIVCRGTYHEQVVLSKPLSLVGQRATIDEAGVTPALQVSIPGLGTQTIFAAVVILSSHVQFSGFTVRNALGEGVVAAGLTGTISDISIRHNVVMHNDLGGGVPPASTYFECAARDRSPVTAARAFTLSPSPTPRSPETASPITPAGSC